MPPWDAARAKDSTKLAEAPLGNPPTRCPRGWQRDTLNRLTTVTFPCGSTLRYAYDANGNQLTLSGTSGGATTSTWDANNRLWSRKDAQNRVWSYRYNADGELTRLTYPDGEYTTYAYEDYNELCASGTTSGLACATPPSGSVTKYTYDANGNNVGRTSSSTSAYTFDLDNRLVQAVTPAGTYTFAYDGLGDRIQETGPSGGQKTYTNTYVASGDAMLYLKDVVGSTTTKTVYPYAGSLLVATVSGGTYSYFHADALGDTRLVTQAGHGGKVTTVFSTNYEPFGMPHEETRSRSDRFLRCVAREVVVRKRALRGKDLYLDET